MTDVPGTTRDELFQLHLHRVQRYIDAGIPSAEGKSADKAKTDREKWVEALQTLSLSAKNLATLVSLEAENG